ncbi:MAG: ArsA-related P-loop ATPase [Deltaproteobacteria bacterium]
MTKLNRILEEKSVIICIGAGGVGKTTISSLLALEAASKGKRTLALTVDPSRRLAKSLGISEGSEFGVILPRRLGNAGYAGSSGLTVRVLDVKNTFDRLIERVADSSETSGRILSNNYYKSVADSLAGAHEYMAMEALLSSYEEGEYDIIIVDTPPSEHLSGFLSAPLRLSSILDSEIFKSFHFIDRMSLGFTRLFTLMSLKFAERIVGIDVIHDMWEFFSDFEAVNEGIKARAAKTYNLLKSDSSSFLIVTNLKERSLQNTFDWHNELTSDGYDVDAVIVNRAAVDKDLSQLKEPDYKDIPGGREFRQKLLRNYDNYRSLISAEKAALERLQSRLTSYAIPDLDTEVITLKDLRGIREYLFD